MTDIIKPFLSGTKIFLRSIESTDISVIARWLNDPRVTHYMFYGQLPTTLAQVEMMIGDQVVSSKNVVFAVCDLTSKKLIGFAGLYDIHLTAQKAEFRVMIGETDFWGKGIGTEVTELLTYYGFDRLNLHKIYLGVTAENLGGLRAYERAGYVHEGVSRDEIYRNSRYYDAIRLSLLRTEYYEKFFVQHQQKFGGAGDQQK